MKLRVNVRDRLGAGDASALQILDGLRFLQVIERGSAQPGFECLLVEARQRGDLRLGVAGVAFPAVGKLSVGLERCNGDGAVLFVRAGIGGYGVAQRSVLLGSIESFFVRFFPRLFYLEIAFCFWPGGFRHL